MKILLVFGAAIIGFIFFKIMSFTFQKFYPTSLHIIFALIISFIIFLFSPILLVFVLILAWSWCIFPKVKKIINNLLIAFGFVVVAFFLLIFFSTEPKPKENTITPSDFASLSCLRRSLLWCAFDVLTDSD